MFMQFNYRSTISGPEREIGYVFQHIGYKLISLAIHDYYYPKKILHTKKSNSYI